MTFYFQRRKCTRGKSTFFAQNITFLTSASRSYCSLLPPSYQFRLGTFLGLMDFTWTATNRFRAWKSGFYSRCVVVLCRVVEPRQEVKLNGLFWAILQTESLRIRCFKQGKAIILKETSWHDNKTIATRSQRSPCCILSQRVSVNFKFSQSWMRSKTPAFKPLIPGTNYAKPANPVKTQHLGRNTGIILTQKLSRSHFVQVQGKIPDFSLMNNHWRTPAGVPTTNDVSRGQRYWSLSK